MRRAGKTSGSGDIGMTWSFAWLRSWDEVWATQHVADWQQLCERPDAYATPFMHPDLVGAWLEVIGQRTESDPFFLHAKHRDGQEVLWLLVRPRPTWQNGWARRLVPAGDGPGGPYFGYNDPLVVPELAPGQPLAAGFWSAFHRELAAHAGSWFDTCTFHRLRPECLDSISGEPVPGGSTYVRLDAYADFEAYAAARPATLASQVRRKLHRLQSDGRCEFHIYGTGERDAALASVHELEEGRLVRYPESVLPSGYLNTIVARGFDSGLVRCSVLKIDGRTASWRLDYRLGRTLYLAECTFDQAFARYSPGQLHSWLILQWHFAHGGRVYDALIGRQAYKYDWTDGAEHKLRRIHFESRAPATVARRQLLRGLGRMRRLAGRARLAG